MNDEDDKILGLRVCKEGGQKQRGAAVGKASCCLEVKTNVEYIGYDGSSGFRTVPSEVFRGGTMGNAMWIRGRRRTLGVMEGRGRRILRRKRQWRAASVVR